MKKRRKLTEEETARFLKNKKNKEKRFRLKHSLTQMDNSYAGIQEFLIPPVIREEEILEDENKNEKEKERGTKDDN